MIIKKVGIIGQGFVGTALKEAFLPHYETLTYDKFRDDLSTHSSIAGVSRECDAIFVCVPTPMSPDGSCDTSIVDTVCEEISSSAGRFCSGITHPTWEGIDFSATERIIVIKSTVPPSFTQQKNHSSEGEFVFNPEFLMERSATEDFKNTNRVILGGSQRATSVLKQFYLKVFPDADITETDPTTAEFVKYITNSFLAAKVSIANEFSLLCSAFGVDYNEVIEYATLDERLGRSHWAVGSSSPDGKLGFGGTCFPKDLNAIIAVAESLSLSMDTLKGAWETNLRVRPEKDWEQ
jgi:UDPglucose 6-dehydrogenase